MTKPTPATGIRPALDSGATLDPDDIAARKKDLVAALDRLIEPLDKILQLLQHTDARLGSAYRGGVLLLVIMAVMAGVQVHTTLRMATVQEQLAEVVAAQKTLQQTTTQVADKQTATQNALDQQSQITIEPSMGPDGSPTAIVVVKPPPAASALPAIPLPLAPPTVDVPGGARLKAGGPHRPHPAAPTDASAPPPAPAAPIKFE